MQKIAILYDASQAVMSTFDLDEVLAQILQIVRDYFQIGNGAVLLYDPLRNDLYVRKQFNRAGTESVRIPMGEGLTGSAARLKRPVYAGDVRNDPRYINTVATTRSELAIPLLIRDEVVGVLDMQSTRPNFFDNETIDLLMLFSTQASIAIENARLYSLEQRRARQMEAINAIARQTTALIELDELLEKVCVAILERFTTDHVSILLLEGSQLLLRAHRGKLTPLLATGDEIPGEAGLTSESLKLGRSVLQNDVSRATGYIPGYTEARAELCVPLIFFGEKLGVLVLDSKTPGAFLQSDITPLESVADICAAAIQNAHHFESAKQLAYLDGLTGIFNRRFFEMRIVEELERAQRYKSEMSVIMLDIDNFKKLNDEFGHLLGDEVLRQVSTILQQHLRKGDVVCRFGGEEFAILLPQANAESAMEVADKLRRAIETWHFPGVPRPVTVSAGTAQYPEFGVTRDEVVSAADSALYLAKQAGRNCVINSSRSKKTTA
ncbi:MAG TPA: sensor domain-containing diguanylate cyclase [Terriglobales bacterium]|nr:sensor domain-containing diguanylate cyclase [Terriglobales bacterium]